MTFESLALMNMECRCDVNPKISTIGLVFVWPACLVPQCLCAVVHFTLFVAFPFDFSSVMEL